MPKGALLHAHLDATVNARILLDLALKQPAFHIRTLELLTPTSVLTVLPQFQPLSTAEATQTTARSLTDPNYQPNEWVPLTAARDNFDAALGGPEGFDMWVLGTLMINPREAYETHNTVDKARFYS